MYALHLPVLSPANRVHRVCVYQTWRSFVSRLKFPVEIQYVFPWASGRFTIENRVERDRVTAC